jgi:23S rRNA pseudouridine1911/1915/1917 synthase
MPTHRIWTAQNREKLILYRGEHKGQGAEPGSLQVLYEDNHCIAALKPARLLTAGDRTGDVSLLDLVRDYLKQKYRKPGNVFVGPVHRLDRPVSGVVLFARTSKGAARLSEQFREGTVLKMYQAVVEGTVADPHGEFVDWLLKTAETNTVRSVPAETPAARLSRLRFRRITKAGRLTLLEITPETGRSHQIRVQLAVHGHPICGDGKYGSKKTMHGAIALHASMLTFDHPTRHEPITVTAPEPANWQSLFPALRQGGAGGVASND